MARINKTNQRADKFMITGIKNMKRGNGTYIMEGRSRLVKEVDYRTMSCPECGTEARYDNNGDIVCDDDTCAVVLSDDGEKHYPLIFPDVGQWHDSDERDSGTSSRGASGHPLTRVPALRDQGPSGDDRL